MYNRAYYTMFHAAKAVLLYKDIERNSHRGVISALGEFLAKPGLMDPKFHQYFREAFDLRQNSDYSSMSNISPKEAEETFKRAKELLEVCTQLCK